MTAVAAEPQTVITDGWRLYVPGHRPGVFYEVGRTGRRRGVTCVFEYPVDWQPARLCDLDPRRTLTCARCGAYDLQYAQTAVRSYCTDQGHGALA